MPGGKLSIGDDTPSGEPEAGPKGPYITDNSDDEVAERRKPSPKRKTRETNAGRRPAAAKRR